MLLTLVEKNLLQVSDISCNLPKTGEVIVILLRDKNLIALVIKPFMDTKLIKKDLDMTLKNLAAVIDKFDLQSISIIKDLDIFNAPQVLLFIERLNHYLGSKKIIATFYHNNLPIPPVDERQKIIRQYHEPPMMGHRGYKKTLQFLQTINGDTCVMKRYNLCVVVQIVKNPKTQKSKLDSRC